MAARVLFLVRYGRSVGTAGVDKCVSTCCNQRTFLSLFCNFPNCAIPECAAIQGCAVKSAIRQKKTAIHILPVRPRKAAQESEVTLLRQPVGCTQIGSAARLCTPVKISICVQNDSRQRVLSIRWSTGKIVEYSFRTGFTHLPHRPILSSPAGRSHAVDVSAFVKERHPDDVASVRGAAGEVVQDGQATLA